MTPSELAAAVEAGESASLLRMLRSATEAERRAAAPIALELRRRFDDLSGVGTLEQNEASKVATWGTAVVTELRKLRGTGPLPPRRHEFDVLAGRPAAVVGPIASWRLQRYFGWHSVRELVRTGVIPRPQTEWYILRLIASHGTPAEWLATDPGLLEHEVWRLFEVEGSGEFCLAAHDKYVAERDTWQTALVGVAAEPSRRARLLDASLDALARDFSTFRAGWFSRFHEALAPTIDERAERVDAYVTLLRSASRPTVTLAVAALEQLQRAGCLDSERVLGRLGPALPAAPSSTALRGVRLLRRMAAADKTSAARVCRELLQAVGHASADVQSAALEAVRALMAGPDAELAGLLSAHVPGISPSCRVAADQLLTALGASPAPGPDHDAAMADGPNRSARRPTDPERALIQVADIDELVGLLASLLEDAEAADDLERALDGLARLADRLTDERAAAPLAKRARTVMNRSLGDRQATDLRQDIACMVVSWVDRDVVEPMRLREGYGPWPSGRVDRFLGRRLLHVARAAANRRPVRLLGTPTHRGGWIDPRTLVARLREHGNEPVETLDLIQALLRLAPDGRADALVQAEGVPGEPGAALRHSLGGHEGVASTSPIWAAAARARSANEDDPAVAERHPSLGPNAGAAARIGFVVSNDWREVFGGINLIVDPPMPADEADELPATAMLRAPFPAGFGAGGDAGMCRWVATVWPAGTEAWAAVGAVVLGSNVDWWSADWTNRVHLEAFLEPWATFGPMARAMLGIALGARERGERGLAADVAVAAIGDGRMGGAVLADILAASVPLLCARPRRWAESLAEVAFVSPTHAREVAAGIGAALPALPGVAPADLVPLLRLLNELVSSGSGRLDPEAARVLRDLPGRGVARRLADAILAADAAYDQPTTAEEPNTP